MLRDFIVKEIEKTELPVKTNQKNLFIPCPFHEDTDPSLSISLGEDTKAGVFHCFGCSASGTWNALAKKLGLKTITEDTLEESKYYLNKTKVTIFTPLEEDDLSLQELDFTWRKHPIKFLKKFGIKTMWHDKYNDYYLYMPITYLYEYKGFIRAKLHKNSYGPKYWFNISEKIPYPIDYIFNFHTPVIVLTEGPADSLRLISKNIPALSLLGNTVTKNIIEILKENEIKTIILCLDGDEAGRNAVIGHRNSKGEKIEGIALKLEKEGFIVKVLFPPEGKDPDNMPKKYFSVLKYMIKDNKGKLLKISKGIRDDE